MDLEQYRTHSKKTFSPVLNGQCNVSYFKNKQKLSKTIPVIVKGTSGLAHDKTILFIVQGVKDKRMEVFITNERDLTIS